MLSIIYRFGAAALATVGVCWLMFGLSRGDASFYMHIAVGLLLALGGAGLEWLARGADDEKTSMPREIGVSLQFLTAGLLLVVAAAWAWSSSTPEKPKLDDKVGQTLFPEFKDPTASKSLKITRYDENQSEFTEFEVAFTKAGWTIPSHGDYPADADAQMKAAATLLIGVTIKDVIPDDPPDHERFGVREPAKSKIKVGDKGVGVMVAMRNSKGQDLARLIIGKKVKGDDKARFVRKPGQDPVYIAEIDPDKLSTKFEDWIEKDLLKISSWNIKRVTLKDYQASLDIQQRLTPEGVVLVPVPTYRPKFDLEVREGASGDWSLGALTRYANGAETASELGANEELDKKKLDDLKTSIDELAIIDVSRKPKGVGADLRLASDLIQNQELVQSLLEKGFVPIPAKDDKSIELLAATGEVYAHMEDGVDYLLRFGKSAGSTGKDDAKPSRYLLVSARPGEATFPKPELAALPPEPAADASEQQKKEHQTQKETIEKENQRKLDEWNKKRDDARKKADEANARFADWFYVVSDDVYKKIRLNYSEVIKEKAGVQEQGFGVDAFRELEEKGLRKEDASAAP